MAVEPAASVTDPPAAAPDPAVGTAPADADGGTDSGHRAGEDAEPVPAAAVPARRADPGAAARMFDAATTRRRSVVFEEDDDLDVPDFLK